MVFSGDEIGQEGILGEDDRRPCPWHRRDTWDEPTWLFYRDLVRLRRDHDELRRGGLRRVHAAGDLLSCARERTSAWSSRRPGRADRVSGRPRRRSVSP